MEEPSMRKSWIAASVLIVALSVPALAKGPKKDNSHASPAAKQDKGGKSDKDHGWEKRDGVEMRVFGPHDGRPEGWSKGKKTGWQDCGLPPGQAKKYQCYTYKHRGRRYYYYNDVSGRLIVRRSGVSIFAVF
jgi:hypothetical protein